MTQDEEQKLMELMQQDMMGQQTPTVDVSGYGTFASPNVADTAIVTLEAANGS